MRTLTTAAIPGAPVPAKSWARWICSRGKMMRGILRRGWPAMACAAFVASASAQSDTLLYSFDKAKHGALPGYNGNAVILPNGHLIGTAEGGLLYHYLNYTADSGVVFEEIPPTKNKPEWHYKVIYRFQGPPDGADPSNGLTLGSGGLLYGVTMGGGNTPEGYIGGCGTVYQLTPSTESDTGKWEETVLYSFAPPGSVGDGCEPYNTNLMFDPTTGSLYGTTQAGGQYGQGTLFRLDPPAVAGDTTWTETVLYSFSGGLDGGNPSGALAGDPAGGAGTIYGTAQNGGDGSGLVWKFYLSDDQMAAAYYFQGGSDGASPVGGVIGPYPYAPSSPDYYLLATTYAGGGSPNCTNGCGTVVAINLPFLTGDIGTDTVLHAYDGYVYGDGEAPVAGLVMIGSAAWGTTSLGGNPYNCPGIGCGILFQVQLTEGVAGHISLNYSWVYSFEGGTGDGAFPATGVAGDSAGNVIGMTQLGGADDWGTLFEYTP